jgi:anti-anti-sigma factor
VQRIKLDRRRENCILRKPKIPLLYKTSKSLTHKPFIYKMNVKIDTKEKFTVITPELADLPANMTAELGNLLLPYLQKDIPHIILNMNEIQSVDETGAEAIATIQQQFYENNCSFVICNLQENVEKLLDEKELLEVMNVTPTESEAWDIVQMEEIERELLDGEE